MLVIQMPEDEGKQRAARRRRWRGVAYLVTGLIIMACIFLAWDKPAIIAVITVEAWWIWAVNTDPKMWNRRR